MYIINSLKMVWLPLPPSPSLSLSLSLSPLLSSSSLSHTPLSSPDRENLIILSGGAPYDLVDGDSITIHDGEETTTLQLTSGVRGMHILEDCQTDKDSGIVGATSDMETVTTGQFWARPCIPLMLMFAGLLEKCCITSPWLHFAVAVSRCLFCRKLLYMWFWFCFQTSFRGCELKLVPLLPLHDH